MAEEQNLGDKIELKASFCLGNCSNGVSMQIDGEPIQNVTPDNLEEIFNEKIISRI